MGKPTDFEIDLVKAILDEQRDRHPLLWAQVPYLRVRSRELTGVGGYINFDLAEGGQNLIDNGYREGVLTVNKMVRIEDTRTEMGFAIDIAEGRINFLELFTYGDEEWAGEHRNYSILDV